MNLRLIGAGLLAIAAFAAGSRIENWRLESSYERERARNTAAVNEALAAAQRRLKEQNDETVARESALAERLAAAQQQTEDLRREIADRPVIRQVVRTAVAGQCPAVPAVDWGVFVELYNRAAVGDAGP